VLPGVPAPMEALLVLQIALALPIQTLAARAVAALAQLAETDRLAHRLIIVPVAAVLAGGKPTQTVIVPGELR
jgi:hypothetical protein